MDEHEYLNQRWHDIRFQAQVSYLYHRKRQRHWDLLDKGTKGAAIVLGAGTMAQALSAYVPWLGGAISGLGLLSLVYGYSDRKQQHRELADDYARFAAEIESIGPRDYTEAHLNKWAARQQELNAKEPPTLHTLTTLCQNTVTAVLNSNLPLVKVPWYKRTLADFVSFG